jgi:nucleoside-diphosphate-sugar epimerase
MRFAITGICGRLGRAIAAEARAQGHTVVGVDTKPWPPRHSLPPGIHVLVGSFEDINLMKELLQSCDAVIHTAGLHGEHLGKSDLAEYLHLNVQSVARLFETALNVGVRRVVLSSTMEILLGRDWTASGAAFVDEESTPRPDSAYSISCLLREQLGRELSRLHDVSVSSLRYMAFSNTPDETLGLRLLARSVSSRDAARAALCAASLDGLKGEVFHIGPKTPLANSDIVAALSDSKVILEKHFPGATLILDKHGFNTKSEYFWPVTSIRKAKLILDWEPEYTFEVWLTAHGWVKN